MVPIAYIFIRDRPEDVGLWPDNKENLDEQMEAVNIDLDKEDAWTAKEAMSTRSFWFIIYCIIVPSAIVTALIFHQFSVILCEFYTDGISVWNFIGRYNGSSVYCKWFYLA